MVFPTQIDVTNATRIAFATNRTESPRWTEVTVYWLGDPFFRRKQWLARWDVFSTIEGEDGRMGAEQGGTLEKAMKDAFEKGGGLRLIRRQVDDVMDQAFAWREANAEMVERFYQSLRATDPSRA